MANASHDDNRNATLLGISSVDGTTPVRIAANPSTGAMLIDGTSLYATLDTRYVNVTGDTMTGSLTVNNVRISGNTISTINTNGDLILSPNGTGMVQVAILHAATSAGLVVHNASSQDIVLLGAGGGQNATFYDGVKLDAGTASRVLITDANKNISYSTATSSDVANIAGLASFTQGSVVFAGTSGLLSQDNTNFFWNDSTDRLGIGLNNPSYDVDINGDLNVGSSLAASATGGTITASGGYTIHTFTTSGTFTPNGSFSVEYLVVAGGGGGAIGAGGGGGGLRSGSLTVSAQAYSITVGAGGNGSGDWGAPGSNGTDSIFSSITSTGGGGGGSGASQAGVSGGSGGGSWNGFSAGSGTVGQGNAGGVGATNIGGGGGGSGGAGGTGSASGNGTGGAGGAGTDSSISGSSVGYAGGGGGTTYMDSYASGTAGTATHGGGNASTTGSGSNGTANRGGGGGSGRSAQYPTTGGTGGHPGGNGGSGVVIIRYLTSATASTPALTTDITNQRVGIMNTAPANTFSVGAASEFQVTSAGIVRAAVGSVSTPGISFVNDTNTGIYNTTNTLLFATDGTERARIGSTGNVGIGMTPSARLDITNNADQIGFRVKGNATQTTNVMEAENSGGTDLFTLSNAGFGYFADGLESDYWQDANNAIATYGVVPRTTFRRRSSGVTEFVVSPNGNQTADSSVLKVYATDYAADSSNGWYGVWDALGSSGNAAWAGLGSTANSVFLTTANEGSTTGFHDFIFGVTNTGGDYTTSQDVLRLKSATTPVVIVNEGGIDCDFRVESDGDANNIFSDGSTNRVGIGTSSPSVKFDVNGIVKSVGRRQAVAIKSADYTLTTADEVVVFTATATATLPAATGTGQTYRIVCRAGALTIDSGSGKTIKGERYQYLTSGEDLIISDVETNIWE